MKRGTSLLDPKDWGGEGDKIQGRKTKWLKIPSRAVEGLDRDEARERWKTWKPDVGHERERRSLVRLSSNWVTDCMKVFQFKSFKIATSQQRSGRPPPQTRQTPGGHCPCLEPATGSQRNLKYPQGTAEDKNRRLVHSWAPYSGSWVPVGSSRPTDHQQVTDCCRTPLYLWLHPRLPASALVTCHSV